MFSYLLKRGNIKEILFNFVELVNGASKTMSFYRNYLHKETKIGNESFPFCFFPVNTCFQKIVTFWSNEITLEHVQMWLNHSVICIIVMS